eukprot:233135_1
MDKYYKNFHDRGMDQMGDLFSIDVDDDFLYETLLITDFRDIKKIKKSIENYKKTPLLLELEDKQAGTGVAGMIRVRWDILRINKNKNEKMKVEWISHSDDEKKEEKEEWNNKIVELNDKINKETTVSVSQSGIYKFQLSYNNGVKNDYSPKSNMKSIS